MSLEQGQDARGGIATLAGDLPRNGNGADAAARDLLFIEQLKVGQAELASDALLIAGLLHDSVASARQHAAEHGIELSVTRCDRVVSSRRGDRRRLMQAFDQLLRNAIQYSPRDSEVEIQGLLLDSSYVIEIIDHGPGIPPDEMDAVYDAFFRGSNALQQGIEGRGIGLTVARAIIEAHGGSLKMASDGHNGASVAVELPA